jgi:3-oxoacyl-[acyl-carrier-protein] synthase II
MVLALAALEWSRVLSDEIVITGVGVVCPIGIGCEPVWRAFCEGRSGIGPIRSFDASGLPVRIAGEIEGFDPKAFVKPRKNLKVMCRDSQLGVAASSLASRHAGIAPEVVDPEQFGVVFGADAICNEMRDSEGPYRNCTVDGRFRYELWGKEGIADTFPLSFLKVLPNMIASHISIVLDARGPNNTIHQAEVSSLTALVEACRVIQRGAADVMLAGGASSRMNPFDWVRHCLIGRLSTSQRDPKTVLRPFDADRDGQVCGEGAAAFILERLSHARARGAPILARILGWSTVCEPRRGAGINGDGLERAITSAMARAQLSPDRLGHVNAHGTSLGIDDRIEARAIASTLGDVPVTAPKSYFGNLGAAGGAVELVASVLSFEDRLVPQTLNYRHRDPECPVRVIREEPLGSSTPTSLAINWTWQGQAVAVVLAGAD